MQGEKKAQEGGQEETWPQKGKTGEKRGKTGEKDWQERRRKAGRLQTRGRTTQDTDSRLLCQLCQLQPQAPPPSQDPHLVKAEAAATGRPGSQD